jgi:hypothetical protein
MFWCFCCSGDSRTSHEQRFSLYLSFIIFVAILINLISNPKLLGTVQVTTMLETLSQWMILLARAISFYSKVTILSGVSWSIRYDIPQNIFFDQRYTSKNITHIIHSNQGRKQRVTGIHITLVSRTSIDPGPLSRDKADRGWVKRFFWVPSAYGHVWCGVAVNPWPLTKTRRPIVSRTYLHMYHMHTLTKAPPAGTCLLFFFPATTR